MSSKDYASPWTRGRRVIADHDHSCYLDRPYLNDAAAAMVLEPTPAVLFAGDIHGSLGQVSWLAARAERAGANVILQAGDLGYWPHTDPRFIAKADKILARHHVHMVAIDGNHENFAALGSDHPTFGPFRVLGRRILHAPRGAVWEWHGRRILAVGGAPSQDRLWRRAQEDKGKKAHKRTRWLWWHEEEITDADVDLASAAGKVDILLSHECPESVRLPVELSASRLSQLSRQRAQRIIAATRPRLIVHGHYHARYSGVAGGVGWSARVEGLGRDGMGEASCLCLDLRDPIPAP